MTAPLIYTPAHPRIDASNAGVAENDIQQLFAQSASGSLLIDLSGVGYLSSAGLRVLLIAAKTAKLRGGKVAIASPQPSVKDIIVMSGFDKLIAICSDRAAGLASLQA
ncbi:MAG: STAS domain-containing protein [Pseudomonadota bacterium]|jgi:anti-anti-sigma factor